MLENPPNPTEVAALEPLRSSPIAWTLAGLLALLALYFIIRLLEWDAVNGRTPNQDDPLPR